MERTLGIGWKPAYLASTVGLSACFYFTVGLASVIAVGRAEKRKNRLLQIFVLPLAVIGVAFLIRLAAYGYLPIALAEPGSESLFSMDFRARLIPCAFAVQANVDQILRCGGQSGPVGEQFQRELALGIQSEWRY